MLSHVHFFVIEIFKKKKKNPFRYNRNIIIKRTIIYVSL